MLCYLAISPPQKINDRIMKIRNEYQRRDISAPHITIVPPFTPKTNLDLICAKLALVARDVKCFNIELDGLGTFSSSRAEYGDVLFISLRDDGPLLSLQGSLLNNIREDIGGLKENFSTKFHVTILKRMTYEKIMVAKQTIKPATFNESFVASHIILFGKENNEPWQIKERFQLKDA